MRQSHRNIGAIGCWIMLTLAVAADDIRLYPPRAHLFGSTTKQQILAVRLDKEQNLTDITSSLQFTSSRPDIVQVIDGRWLQAVNNGEAVISIQHAGASITPNIQVRVSGTQVDHHPSFSNDIIPLLTRVGCNAGACHGALAGKGGLKLSLRGFDPESDHFVLTRQTGGRRVDFRHPEQSLALLKPTGALKHGGGQKFDIDAQEYALLQKWIAHGAPGPNAKDPTLIKLDVYPPTARLSIESKLPLIVQATYSDGRTADVTHWVKFASTQEQVLRVDDQGLLTVTGRGAGAVTVWFSNHVATMNVLSPFNTATNARTMIAQTLSEMNFIDQHVNQRLMELGLPASPLCTDQVWIRRVYLDTIGILPTPEGTRQFIADASPNKRTRLIEAILRRPEFTDYWSYFWSDLLLVSTKKLPQSNVWAFSGFVRHAVAENWPWDKFARELLTAQGSNLENGAANYFVLHKDVSELTETTAITFLGTSITCARCHNHPLEKWTQDQYWSMANLFGRVGIKNGERGNEVIVQPLAEGDVLHLRRGVPMPPTPLDGQPLPASSQLDRRTHLVNWMTSKQNPFFAKAVVNRIWRNFMGRGLIEAEDDIRQTNPPTNPALLSALEKDFVEHGFDIKHLMRQILLSTAYQRSAQPIPGNEDDDRFYSRYLPRRLKAEVILDAYSQVTGVPTPFTQLESGGRDSNTPTSDYPLGTRALQLADTKVVSRFLTSFGRPERDQACACERDAEATVGQSLHLNNGQTLNDKLRSPASIVDRWLKNQTPDQSAIKELFQLAFSRPPSSKEMNQFSELLKAGQSQSISRREALEDMVWAVLSSKEFVFNH